MDFVVFDEYISRPIKGRLQRESLTLFDHEVHQKLATDVTRVSFDAQRHEESVHEVSAGYGILEVRVLGWIHFSKCSYCRWH